MALDQAKLREIWIRTDEYFKFKLKENVQFGPRLKTWREIHGLSQIDMATAIYERRLELGLEDEDVSNEKLKEENKYTGKEEFKPIDYDLEAKRNQKRERRISSLRISYNQWENQNMTYPLPDTSFSMTNLRILKDILGCDYQFLFCEIDVPHRYTQELEQHTGLAISTIEKLSYYCALFRNDKNDSIFSEYARLMISALDTLLADDDIMIYLSWYLNQLDDEKDLPGSDEEGFTTILINRPLAGSPMKATCKNGASDKLLYDDIHLVYWITIANKLNGLRLSPKKDTSNPIESEVDDNIILAEDSDSFGQRLRKWRKHRKLTQDQVADLIFNYRIENKLIKTIKGNPYELDKKSIRRTYQNWEMTNTSFSKSNKRMRCDVRISLNDLFILKHIMGCDYEYLFGDINTLTLPSYSPHQVIGLSQQNIEKLSSYVAPMIEAPSDTQEYADRIISTIDLIVNDDEFLSYLTYYLSDMELNIAMHFCSILKPAFLRIPSAIMDNQYFSQEAYERYLFPEDGELKNVLFPLIFRRLKAMRDRYQYNYKPMTTNS